MPRFSRFQREIQRKVALEWDLDHPYVPSQIMDIVENSRGEWEDDLVWDFLHVPKPLRVPESDAWAQFMDIREEWKLGHAIYRDRVLVVKVGQPTRCHSVSVIEEGDSRRRLPDPHFYV